MFKRKLFAAAVAVALAGGASTAGALTASTANAATPSCGGSCVNVFSPQFGTHHHPSFIMDSFRQGTRTGNPIILFQASNNDPAEDFVLSVQGSVADFFQAGLVTSSVALHYGCVAGVTFHTCNPAVSTNDPAWEMEYAPFGAPTGECVGVARTAGQGTPVTLQPCGASSKTIWIGDTLDGHFTSFLHGHFPMINGSDTNFSHPFVLTYPFAAHPTDHPRPVLMTAALTGHSNGPFPVLTTINSNQLWGITIGVIH